MKCFASSMWQKVASIGGRLTKEGVTASTNLGAPRDSSENLLIRDLDRVDMLQELRGTINEGREVRGEGAQHQYSEGSGQQVESRTSFASLVTRPAASIVQGSQHNIEPLEQREPQAIEQEPAFALRIAGLVVTWILTMIVVHTATLIAPVSLGRAMCLLLFDFYRNAFSNLPGTPIHDLFTSYVGVVLLYALFDLGRGVLQARHRMGIDVANMVQYGFQAVVTFINGFIFCILWLGFVGMGLGCLIELALRPVGAFVSGEVMDVQPMRAWTKGYLALVLWHIYIHVYKRDERQHEREDHRLWLGGLEDITIQEELVALQRDGLRNGLRNMELGRVLIRLVLPMALLVTASLLVPYLLARCLGSLAGAPEKLVDFAELHAHLVLVAILVAFYGVSRVRTLFWKLHNAVRDDQFLIRQELNNFDQ